MILGPSDIRVRQCRMFEPTGAVKETGEQGEKSQGCIKLGKANACGRAGAVSRFVVQIGFRRLNRRMPLQRLKWFSSIQSREVAPRLGRPLAQTCFKALDRRRKIPRTDAAPG